MSIKRFKIGVSFTPITTLTAVTVIRIIWR
jgi:hypothetical protein